MGRRLGLGSVATGAAGDAGTATGRRIAGNLGLQLGGRLAAATVSLATLPLLVRTLGVEGFGVWSTALAYVGLYAALTEFGLTQAATLKMAGDPEHEAEWLGALARLRTMLAVGAAGLAVAGVPFVLDAEGDARLAGLLLCSTILTVSAAALTSVFQSRLRGGVPLVLTLVQSALWLAAVVVLAVLDAGVVAFAVALSATLAVVAALALLSTRRMLTARRTRERSGALLRLALPIGLTGVFSTAYYKIDQVLLYRLADTREAGVYGAAYRILDPLVLLPVLLMATFLPVLSALRGRDDARVRRVVQACFDAMAALSVPVVVTTIVLAGPIVALLFGSGYERTATILPILTGAYVAICYGALAGGLASVLGITWRVTGYAFAGLMANVALNVLLIEEHGGVGSAWATVATEGLTMALALATGLHVLGFRPRLRRVGGVLAAAGLMAAAMLLLRPVGLLPALVAGAGVYAGALAALGVVKPAQLRALARG